VVLSLTAPCGAVTKSFATFEAKYSVPRYTSSRGHIFQAMTAAAAIDSPLAVLVYPEDAAPIIWGSATSGNPRTVLAVGLDMYSFRRGTGDEEKGQYLWRAIRSHLNSLTEKPSGTDS